MRSHDDPRQSPPFLRLSCILLVIVATTRAYADDVDVAAFEYVDVIETAEGSILRGVVTEQTPNLTYKLATADGSIHVIRAASVVKVSKQRNPKYRTRAAAAMPIAPFDEPEAVTASAPSLVRSGFRMAPELAIVQPTGDLVQIAGTPLSYRSSFAQGATIGYEHISRGVGLHVGGLVRYTSWRLPVEVAAIGSHSTLETQLFGRASIRTLGLLAPYAGLALGADTNRTLNRGNGVSSTILTFGMNVQAGVAISAHPSFALDFGLDFHPGTDEIEPGTGASVSYYAFRLGALIRI